jgi:uncharacterized membrane protein YqjE
MLLGALAVLVAMALFVWSVRDMSREGILGATLTAAVLYIVHRLFQAFDLTGGRPAPGRFE